MKKKIKTYKKSTLKQPQLTIKSPETQNEDTNFKINSPDMIVKNSFENISSDHFVTKEKYENDMKTIFDIIETQAQNFKEIISELKDMIYKITKENNDTVMAAVTQLCKENFKEHSKHIDSVAKILIQTNQDKPQQKKESKTYADVVTTTKSHKDTSFQKSDKKSFHIALKVPNKANIDSSWIQRNTVLPKTTKIENIIQLKPTKLLCAFCTSKYNFLCEKCKCLNDENCSTCPVKSKLCASCTRNPPKFKSYKLKISAPTTFKLTDFITEKAASFYPENTIISKFNFPIRSNFRKNKVHGLISV